MAKKSNDELEVCGQCKTKFSMYKYNKSDYVYKKDGKYFCCYTCWSKYLKAKEAEREEENGYDFTEESCENCRFIKDDGTCSKWYDDIPDDHWCELWEKRRKVQKKLNFNYIEIKTIGLKKQNKELENEKCSKLEEFLQKEEGEFKINPCALCSRYDKCTVKNKYKKPII